jgi:polyisoprenoid-binding protein YceI
MFIKQAFSADWVTITRLRRQSPAAASMPTPEPSKSKVNATTLKVADRNDSEKDRAEIQQNMLGPEVLDSQRYSEITFRSKSAEPQGENAWRVQGELSLHGETHPIEAEVRGDNGHYHGTVQLRQSEFGIKPVKMAGGAVRVKDEISIDFDIELAR